MRLAKEKGRKENNEGVGMEWNGMETMERRRTKISKSVSECVRVAVM